MTPEHKAKLLAARKAATPKSTYTSAIRKHCLECLGSSHTISCDFSSCPIYPARTAQTAGKTSKTSIKKLIFKYCKECLGIYKLPRDYCVCSSPNCHLYPYRYKLHEKGESE